MSIKINEELALQAAIRQQMDIIVLAATETVQLLKPTDPKQDNVLEKNQIRNVLNVAEESQSVQVVANFIRYQIGRSGTGKGWQHKGFGLQVVKDITEPNEPVRKALDALLAGLQEIVPVTPELRARAHVELMRHYLGYLNRSFTYAISKADNTWTTLAKATNNPKSGSTQQGGA